LSFRLSKTGSVAEFERAIMLERQREGIAKAKADGKYRGRKPTAQAKSEEVRAMRATGSTVPRIVTTLGA
jgi:DNA invertase Pin-like site-specific DNA recombinase